jgi:UDP-GlcNAc3NAcA epimerase
MHWITVLGARPQFIKAAVVSRALRAHPRARETIVHTGQHFDGNMSEVFFDELEIPRPDYNLGIGSASHGAQTGRMLEAVERVLLDEQPDGVLVYGDTNSTLAGALAAAKLHIPVAHVEAGMRSHNRRMPEEVNRVLTDHLASLLLVSTNNAVDCLGKEGISGQHVRLVGDVMYDAALYYAEKAARQSHILPAWGLQPRRYVLATVHRAENTDDPNRLAAIVEGLDKVAEAIPVVFPVHPRTRNTFSRAGIRPPASSQVRMADPVGYFDMLMLEKNAAAIVTDSGGVQKEAYFYGVPCVTLREETEWVELVQCGANRLCPPCSAQAVAEAIHSSMCAFSEEDDSMIASRKFGQAPTQARCFPNIPKNLYGDGAAAARIAEILCSQ